VLAADVCPAGESLIFRNEVDVYFFFDEQGKLIGSLVEALIEG
jgi:hypothetical protein